MTFNSLITLLEQENGSIRILCYDKMHKRIVIDKKCHFKPFNVEQMVNYIKDGEEIEELLENSEFAIVDEIVFHHVEEDNG